MVMQGKREPPDPSVVSASTVGGGDPSLLSLRTDKSSYSIPDDGRAIMIETNRRHKSGNIDTASAVSAASQTSLLIEYFEGARGSGSSPSHRPSVRVKVTPSAQRKLNQQGTREIELRGTDGTRQGSKRIPSYTQRISLSPRTAADDRLMVGSSGKGRSRRSGRSRSRSGDQHGTASQVTYDEEGSGISSFSEHSLAAPPPLNVEVIREGFSPRDSPRPRRAGNEGGQELSRRRSRSLSNDRENVLGEGSSKLTRRRSKSMERERLTKEEREELREQRRLDRKLAELNGSKVSRRDKKHKDKTLKSPRDGKRSRSVSRERSRSRSRNVSNQSDLAQNPVLLGAVEDAIKRLILPHLEEMKKSGAPGPSVDPGAVAAEAARAIRNRHSTTDVTLGTDGPLLVLEPDIDKGTGHGLVLAGEQDDLAHRSDSVRSRGPGFGTGPDPDSHLADGARLPTPPEDFVPMEQAVHDYVRMPEVPTIPSSSHSRDANLAGEYDDHARYGRPYPANASDSGMPRSGRTPPFLSSSEAQPVAPLNISEDISSQRDRMASPTSSVTSLRRNFEAAAANMAKSMREGKGATAGGLSGNLNGSRDAHAYYEGSVTGLSYQGDEEAGADAYETTYRAPIRDRGVEWWVNKEHELHDGAASDIQDEAAFVHRPELNRRSTAESNELRHIEKMAAGQGVRYVEAAMASMRSTPVGLSASMRASVHEQASNASFISQPQLGYSAIPNFEHDLPALDHIQSDIGDEDDVVTNPYGDKSNSRELAMQGGEWTYADGANLDSRNYGEESNLGPSFGVRASALDPGTFNPDLASSRGSLRSAADRDLAPSPQNRGDEGYMSAANPMSPGNRTPENFARELGLYGAMDDVMSEDNLEIIPPPRGHERGGSGNSHGMPSPLYDSAMGRGIDRIQSKDIVALMDHLTVRDAQRNARDTEILITLVRSAAEMRDSFEDLRRLVQEHTRQVITDVEQNTERSVAKLQGPRPLPAPAPRAIRSRAFDEEKEDTTKKASVFRRALRGLSMKSSHDLARIEEMLVTLLSEVEDLKTTSYAYSVSNTASHAGEQSQSQSRQSHSRQSHHSTTKNNTNSNTATPSQPQSALGFNYDLNPVPEEPNISQPIVASRDSAYLAAGSPQAHQGEGEDVNVDRGSPAVDESGMRTPRDFRDVQNGAAESPRHTPPVATSHELTPGKGKDKRESGSSTFPKISRWSETTASSGIRSFFGRKKKTGEPEISRTNSEFEEDWLQGSTADPNSPRARQGLSPAGREGVVEKPSLEANRRSLDIKHPQPRFTYHHSLEQAAEGQPDMYPDPPSPTISTSTTSLNRFIQTGTTYHNISSLSPMVPEGGYGDDEIYTPNRTPKINIDSPMVPGDIGVDDASDSQPTPEKKRKHKHKHRERGERSERHSRHRSSKHRSRDQLSIPHESEEDILGGRSMSSSSRKPAGPRPPSVASNRSYRHGDDPGTPSRRQRASHLTTDTFGV